jgi:hypothetical protein
MSGVGLAKAKAVQDRAAEIEAKAKEDGEEES